MRFRARRRVIVPNPVRLLEGGDSEPAPLAMSGVVAPLLSDSAIRRRSWADDDRSLTLASARIFAPSADCSTPRADKVGTWINTPFGSSAFSRAVRGRQTELSLNPKTQKAHLVPILAGSSGRAKHENAMPR